MTAPGAAAHRARHNQTNVRTNKAEESATYHTLHDCEAARNPQSKRPTRAPGPVERCRWRVATRAGAASANLQKMLVSALTFGRLGLRVLKAGCAASRRRV